MTRPSQPACPDRRDVLVAVAAGDVRRDLALEAHLVACAGCAAFLHNVERQMRALATLRAQRAPRELEGLVVAATQAGHRQDRAVLALRSVGPIKMPRAVDRAIWPVGTGVPPLLDSLIDHDLQDASRSIARRFAGRIERLQAPRTLDARVTSIFSLARLRRDRLVRRFSLVAAALVLVAFTVAGTLFLTDRPAVIAAEPKFIIQRATSTAEFSELAQSTFSALSGGLTDAERIAKGKKL
ncbi:MAG: hypothetical protein JNL28_14955 [Planctomycetes bacterium]|nr:hypothetical protein [Planctomycetota bacterium]